MQFVIQNLWQWVLGYKRALDVVEMEYAVLPAPRNVKGYFANLSQGPGVAVGSYEVPTMHSGALLFSYELQEVLRGDHMMSLHGFPVPELGIYMFSGSLLNKLAGDSYFLPNFAGIEAALFLNRFSPWWNKLERIVHRSLGAIGDGEDVDADMPHGSSGAAPKRARTARFLPPGL